MTRAREKRLRKAKGWLLLQNFTEESRIIKAYRKHFKVDKLCAIKELGMLGILTPQKQAEYEAQWRTELDRRADKADKEQNNEYDASCASCQNNNLFFTVGYTSGGAPYGITLEEEIEIETEKEFEQIEALLETPYHIVDILPKQVPEHSGGQYFAVEKYFLSEPQRASIKQKHANVILKLNCYFDIFVEGEMNPEPKSLVKAVKARHIDVLLDNVLITSEPDDTYITVYNATEDLLNLLRDIAVSEGLFVWKPEE